MGPMQHLISTQRICGAPFTVAAIALAIELWVVGWQRWSIHRVFADRDRSSFTDGLFFALLVTGSRDAVTLIGSFGLFVLFLGVGNAAGRSVLALHFSFTTRSAIANLLIYGALYTLCDYWIHRLKHIGAFWPLHRLHHSATRLSPLVVARGHPLELSF